MAHMGARSGPQRPAPPVPQQLPRMDPAGILPPADWRLR
jgi:hypothetical protein